MTSKIYCSTLGKYSESKKLAQFFYLRKLSVEDILKESVSFTLNDFLFEQIENSEPREFESDMQLRNFYDRLVVIEKRMEEKKTTPVFKSYAVGNCRDISLFLCSILRYNHIPARVRSGFATFFDPVKKHDHWICEYWNESEKRWQWVDGWMYQVQAHIDKLPLFFQESFSSLGMNPLDVDEKFFITGAEAWKNGRENNDFENYGTVVPELKGEWFVRDNMLRDLHCQNKQEPLPWDCWGRMGRENGSIDSGYHEFLNQVSSTLLADDISITNIQSLINQYDSVYSKA
ncbi:transglutaminase-like domain-containing protein [Paludibacteraceae bacterium OttesenSCG-928-F17]|nr:transglutaminase-like domain-containing protein [Paludibacteraceae bacterium OttesenSCG-928-F17]